MKKNKIALFLFIILLITLFILIFIYFYQSIHQEIQIKPKEENVIEEILKTNQNEKITQDFLEWLEKEYGRTKLLSLKNYLNNNEENIWHIIYNYSLNVLLDTYNNTYNDINNLKRIDTITNNIQLSFIGDVSLADNWYIVPKYQERKKQIYGILSEETVNILKNSNITIANNEFTISNRGEKMPGKYYTFRGVPENLNIYKEMGIDLVTLANNHVYDFGEIAFQDTLESLKKYQIPYIGAGKNIEEAIQPYYFIINGYKIAFLNATRAEKFILTPGATTNSSGVFR